MYFYFIITNNATVNNLPYMLFQIYGCVSSGKIPTSETARLKRLSTPNWMKLAVLINGLLCLKGNV